ncbi:NAD kinase [Pradoshia sp. D12]|uniref:NAD kinase n=1 Tax=Bacillaceae TaxID=186817 RepID=UPI00080ADAA4|nr:MULTISPECIES: NAD kinase [Bacillaceae]OCA81847.1 NAD kinase [Bacillus sp. FJAT-27986]QFK72519.1 NAD kinase [Pradoshia sp. D12]TPF70737.1 NAD kinase [Bacillus sp. D12]
MGERRNIFFYYKQGQEMVDQVNKLKDNASNYGFELVDEHKDANIIVSVGDDGTFLQAVRKTGFREDCLYAGISLNKQLNMYCDFYINDTENMVEAVTKPVIEVRKYPTIEVTVDNQISFDCLNECTFRSALIKTMAIDVHIDDILFETFRGDGMIISTPTGSTAYNKSVNGAVVDPLLDCMQVSEIASMNNNHYRTLGASFILAPDRTLSLQVLDNENDYPIIGMDNEAMSIHLTERLDIKLSGRYIKTVKLRNNSFWEKVHRTFL